MAHERNMGIESYLAKGFKKRITGKSDTNFKRNKKLKKLGISISRKGRIKIRGARKYKNRCPQKYGVYILSKWWGKRKDEFWRKYGKKCGLCGSPRFVQLHHAYYGEYGKEKDEDLVPLCQPHHEQLHSIIGKTKKDMRKETLDALEEMALTETSLWK